ncbi:hypothetical protein, partial [Acidithiobacillus thiooxidans]|uniref:hypothetical protein n=1 Tax=Acidithiobacillus thiooxidans TaxID=930 RepID=UPI001F37446D
MDKSGIVAIVQYTEWALAPTTSDRPQTSPAGTLLVPLSSPTARRIDPLWGLRPPLLWQWLPL